MKLTYQATIDDVVEPALRHYFRSKIARQTRLRSSCFGAIFMAIAFYYLARALDSRFLWPVILLGACLGGGLSFFTYQKSATKRIRQHLGQQLEGKLPAETVYEIEGAEVRCSFLGSTIIFSLYDLTLKDEDPYLEMDFGYRGLCTIPQRVFASPVEKEAFLQALTSGQTRSRGLVENFKSL